MPLRKARTMPELLEDKGFPYHVGQLIGSAEMCSWWMMMSGQTEEVQTMGNKLSESVAWFFKSDGSTKKELQN